VSGTTTLPNEDLFAKLASMDPEQEKSAVDAVNSFTRMKMREDGFYRRILPPIMISNDELDKAVQTDGPVLWPRSEAEKIAALAQEAIRFSTDKKIKELAQKALEIWAGRLEE
jgi:hypothetical protein